MSFRDNCLSIEVNEVLDLSGSKFNNSNKLTLKSNCGPSNGQRKFKNRA